MSIAKIAEYMNISAEEAEMLALSGKLDGVIHEMGSSKKPKTSIKELYKIIEMLTNQLESIAYGHEYHTAVLIDKVRHAKIILSEMENRKKNV